MTDPTSFDKSIIDLFDEYEKSKQPIMISFRSMVPNFTSDRATHLIHTYPAKLLAHIPYFFLNNSVLSKRGDLILDPFCGSGTVLLEALLANRNALGADTNPLARLISKVKTKAYDIKQIKTARAKLTKKIARTKCDTLPSVINLDYWFLPHVKNQLGTILKAIKSIEDGEIKEFFLVCLSNCVKKVSLADPRVSVPVKLKVNQYSKKHPFHVSTNNKLLQLQSVDVFAKFTEIVDVNLKRMEEYRTLLPNGRRSLKRLFPDSRNLSNGRRPRGDAVDMIISSPPYAGAQKYIRSSSLSLGWLELDTNTNLKQLDRLTIGREHYRVSEYREFTGTSSKKANIALRKISKKNRLRAHIAATYLSEMEEAFKESVRVLKENGYFVLIAANNVICGEKFKTQEFLCSILEGLGMQVRLKLIDDIRSYGLMTKRNKTASIITREWITVFQKCKP
jgi:DNA modification methylase